MTTVAPTRVLGRARTRESRGSIQDAMAGQEERLAYLHTELAELRQEYRSAFESLCGALEAELAEAQQRQDATLGHHMATLEGLIRASDERIQRTEKELQSGLKATLAYLRRDLQQTSEKLQQALTQRERNDDEIDLAELSGQIIDLQAALKVAGNKHPVALQVEIAQMRQAFVTTLEAIHEMQAESGPGDEIALASLRQQLSHLTTTVEKSAQRQQATAEVQQSDIKAGISRTHAELQHVLDSIQRMPASENGEVGLAVLQRQVAELSDHLERGIHQQADVLKLELQRMGQTVSEAMEALRISAEPNEAQPLDLAPLEQQLVALHNSLELRDRGLDEREDTFHVQLDCLKQQLGAGIVTLEQVTTEGVQRHEKELNALRGQVEHLMAGLRAGEQQQAAHEALDEIRAQVRIALDAVDEREGVLRLPDLQTAFGERAIELESAIETRLARMQSDLQAQIDALGALLQVPTDEGAVFTELTAQVAALQAGIEAMNGSYEAIVREEISVLQQCVREQLGDFQQPAGDERWAGEIVQLADQIAELRTAIERGDTRSIIEGELTSLRVELAGTIEALEQRVTERDTEQHVAALHSALADSRSQQDVLQREIAETRRTLLDALDIPAPLLDVEPLIRRMDELALALHEHKRDSGQEIEQRAAELTTRLDLAQQEMLSALETMQQSRSNEVRAGEAIEELRERFERLRGEQHVELQRALEDVRTEVRAGFDDLTAQRNGDPDLEARLTAVHNLVAGLDDRLTAVTQYQVRHDQEWKGLLQTELASARQDVLRMAIEQVLHEVHERLDVSQPIPRDENGDTEALEEVRCQIADLGDRLSSKADQRALLDDERERALRDELMQLSEQLRSGLENVQGEREQGRTIDSLLLEQHVTRMETMLQDGERERSAIKEDLAQMRQDLSLRLADLQRGQSEREQLPAIDPALLEQRMAQMEMLLQARDRDRNAIQLELGQLRQDLQAGLAELQRARNDRGEEPVADTALMEQHAARFDALLQESQSERNAFQAELVQLRGELQVSLTDLLQQVQDERRQEPAFDPQLLEQHTARVEAAVQQSEHERRATEDEVAQLREQLREALARTQASSVDEVQAGLDTLRTELAELAAMVSNSAGSSQSEDQAVQAELMGLRQDIVVALQTPRVDLEAERRDAEIAALRQELAEVRNALRAGEQAQEKAVAAQRSALREEMLLVLQEGSRQHSEMLQTAVMQMHDELKEALGGLNQENVSTWEKRQAELKMEQFEIERNFARLRQELIAAKAEVADPKKRRLW